MANVATAIDMDPTYLPFERPPDPATLWSAIPRGLRGFIVPSGTLDAKPLNDTQTLALSGILPPGFAYIFAEIAVKISQDVTADWDQQFWLNLQSWYQGNVALSMNWGFNFSTVGLVGGGSVMSPGALETFPKSPMWAPRGTSGIQIVISGVNKGAPVGAAGTVSGFINFWEFDLEQARKYPINSPFPIHSR